MTIHNLQFIIIYITNNNFQNFINTCSIKDSQGFLNDNSCSLSFTTTRPSLKCDPSDFLWWYLSQFLRLWWGNKGQDHNQNIMSLEKNNWGEPLRNLAIQRNVFDARNMEVWANLVESWVWTCVAFHSWSFWSAKGKLHRTTPTYLKPRSIGDRFNKPCYFKTASRLCKNLLQNI